MDEQEQREASGYIALLEAYKEQLETLEKQAVYLQALIQDYAKAKVTIEELGKIEGSMEVLVPIGGGVFVEARYENNNKVLISEGSDIVIEKKTEHAVDTLQKRIDDLNNELIKLNEKAQQIQQKMQEISTNLQKTFKKE